MELIISPSVIASAPPISAELRVKVEFMIWLSELQYTAPPMFAELFKNSVFSIKPSSSTNNAPPRVFAKLLMNAELFIIISSLVAPYTAPAVVALLSLNVQYKMLPPFADQ